MIKRSFDTVLAAILLVLMLPILVGLGSVVRLRLGSPIFFLQTRPGMYGKSFTMIKFRSMTDVQNADGELLPDVKRLTRLGKFLRTHSLDELPQLWNILTGRMSFVGPRPLLMEYLPLYDDYQKKRHDVRPGLTGWAQVNGRNEISWQEKFNLDVWYVENQTFWLDVKILWMTIKKVIAREGISADDHTTMPKFTGSQGLDNK